MGLRDFFRKVFEPAPQIDDSGAEGPEIDAALREDFGASDAGKDDLERQSEVAYGRASFAGPESAEVAADEMEEEEAPPDVDP